MASFAGLQQQKEHVGHHEAAPDRQPPQRRPQLGRGEGVSEKTNSGNFSRFGGREKGFGRIGQRG